MKNGKSGVLPERNEFRAIIIDCVGLKRWDRKPLILKIIGSCGYSEKELRDTSCESISTKLKSYCGIILNELIAEKLLIVDETGQISLEKPKLPEKKEIIDTFLKKYLTEDEIKDKSSKGKRNLLQAVLGDLIKKRGVEAAKAIDVVAYFDTELRKNENVLKTVIECEKTKVYPDTELGKCLSKIYKKYQACQKKQLSQADYQKELEKMIIECISIAGGEFFERLSIMLLTSAYGDRVISNQLTGGPDDDGIDGVLMLKDELDFTEKLFFQAKTKKKATACIALNDVREFVGVMTAEGASKGVLISNSNFHRETIKFATKVPGLRLINKERLCGLMLENKIGLVIDDAGIPYVDEDLFLS